MSKDATLVVRNEQLEAVVAVLQSCDFITLDTEFMRETTYWPQLCLLQIATADDLWLIDPLTEIDLAPLWAALTGDNAPLVVLHAAEQDLELIHLACGSLPPRLFDTQIAATLLGLGEQIGYANLVDQLLGQHLEKSQSRTDWCRRPLSTRQLDYAADDVRYLYQLYPKMHAMLSERGRLDWLDADFQALSDSGRFQTDPDRLWLRVRGQQRVRGNGLAILQALAAWRETEARAQDRPRRWVLPDDLMIDLARHPPNNIGEMTERRGWPKGLGNANQQAVFDRIQAARDLPKSAWPERPEFRRPSPTEEATLTVLQTAARLIAQQQDIAPSLLATSDDLLRFLRDPDAAQALNQGWRRHLAGTPLRAVLLGEMMLGIIDGQPGLYPITN